jgi:polar amino acid transport system substrate-binding protein
VRILAPHGRLRAGINSGNTALTQIDKARGGEPRGITVALARELARRLCVPLELVLYDAASKAVNAVTEDAWDIAFLAVDPKRLEQIIFSPPYLLIEAHFVVRADSPVEKSADVDVPGNRLALGEGTAYELYLSRNCTAAQLERFPTSAMAFDNFLRGHFDATAGIKEVAQAFVNAQPGLRMLADSFLVVEQAIAAPKASAGAAEYLFRFVEGLKANGFVAAALLDNGLTAAVAPPAAVSHGVLT